MSSDKMNNTLALSTFSAGLLILLFSVLISIGGVTHKLVISVAAYLGAGIYFGRRHPSLYLVVGLMLTMPLIILGAGLLIRGGLTNFDIDFFRIWIGSVVIALLASWSGSFWGSKNAKQL